LSLLDVAAGTPVCGQQQQQAPAAAAAEMDKWGWQQVLKSTDNPHLCLSYKNQPAPNPHCY
jgi:hypothetical protein